MIRKIQIALIRAIAAGRPVMLNVHVTGKGITILGDGAHIENCRIENASRATGAPAISSIRSDAQRYGIYEADPDWTSWK
tara:strand:+ start:915 stop:1154 length:240 start_codon:yes stop_codon:yes gene_type:complete